MMPVPIRHDTEPAPDVNRPRQRRKGQGRPGPQRDVRRSTVDPQQASAPALEVTVERLSSDGAGIARAPDGRIAFVPLSAPGDRVRARVVESKRSYLRLEVLELLSPGEDRTEPACPAFGVCGGCAWQHVAYPAQLAAKAAILSDALTRIGRVSLPEPIRVLPSPQAYGYRGRARLLVEDHRPGYRRAASDRQVPVDDCPVLAAPLRTALQALAVSRPANGEWELALGEPDEVHPDGVRVSRLGAADGDGAPLALRAGGETVQIAPGGFAQANGLLFEPLVDAVRAAVGSGERLLELYAGAGFFTLPLARRWAQVLAVESDPVAVGLLRSAASRGGLEGVEAIAEDVGSFAGGARCRAFDAETLFVDPPRAGLGEHVVEALARKGPRRLVYLSCDPATLARDLSGLTPARWSLRFATGFDLFPQTPHVEALVVLER